MFEKVLVPTDFSDHAKKTLRCVTRIPGIGVLVLLHVIDATQYTRRGWTHEPEIENARLLLSDEKKFLESLGMTVITRLEIITSGDIAASIIDVANREKVSTIIMGSRGRGLIKGLLLGSASSGVLRRGNVHQLILRDSVMDAMTGETMNKFCHGFLTRILCPTDFSAPSQVAIDSLKKMREVGEVFLLNVVTRGESKDEIDEEVRKATEQLIHIQKELVTEGIQAQIRIRLGRPTDEINRLAEEEDVTLVIISSHGMGWIRDLLIGSTTHGVAIHSRRPILVVRSSDTR